MFIQRHSFDTCATPSCALGVKFITRRTLALEHNYAVVYYTHISFLESSRAGKFKVVYTRDVYVYYIHDRSMKIEDARQVSSVLIKARAFTLLLRGKKKSELHPLFDLFVGAMLVQTQSRRRLVHDKANLTFYAHCVFVLIMRTR